MLALFFEVTPRPGHLDHYFRHAGILKPVLAKHTGLIWIDRFNSLSRDDVLLSHQLWDDEAAIVRWREDQHHKGSQAAGRERHFADYRIRIIEVAHHSRAGEGSLSFPLSDAAAGGWLVAGHSNGRALAGNGEKFRSVNFDDAYVALAEAANEEDALQLAAAWDDDDAHAWIVAGRMIRDYGMFARGQAPHP